MNLSVGNLAASLLFSGIGFVAFRYGKTTQNYRMLLMGVALMGYSYVTPTTEMNWLVGAALTVGLYFVRE